MELYTAEETRIIRFYHWALAEMEREARDDFPLLSTINHPHFQNQLDVLREMPLEERLLTGRACVRSVHRKALDLTGESLGVDERARVDALIATWTGSGFQRGMLRSNEWFESRSKSGEPILTNPAFRAIVSRKMEEVLSIKARRGRFAPWAYTTWIGDWEIETILETKRSGYPSLQYTHIVRRSDMPFPLKDHVFTHAITQVEGWLGLGQTIWDAPLERDAHEVADSVSRICAHFIDAMQPMLSDLSIESGV